MNDISGNIHLWRYGNDRQNFPGYHLTADARGVEFLVAQFRQLGIKAGRNEIVIPLQGITKDVLSAPNNTEGDKTAVCFAQWKVVLDRSLSQPHFRFTEHFPLLEVEVSLNQLYKIQAGVEDIGRGGGDYSIGGKGDEVLWFWWYNG